MKRLLSMALALLIIASVFTLVLPASLAAEAQLLYTIEGKDCKAAFPKDVATLKTVKEDDKSVLRVIPNSKAEDPTRSVVLDYYGLEIDPATLHGATHMTVDYKYECPEDRRAALGTMKVLFMNTGALTGWVTKFSKTKIKENGWDTILFNLEEFSSKLDTASGAKVNQFHLYPFGDGAKIKNFHKDERVFIGDIKFWKGEPKLDPSDAKPGEIRGFEDKEEVNTEGAKTEEIGETGMLFTRSSLKYATGNTYKADGYKRSTYKDEEMGEVLKIVPNKKATTDEILLDYCNLTIPAKDIAKVRYIAINYKYVSNPEIRGAQDKMKILMMPQSGAINGWIEATSATRISENAWDKIVFDVRIMDQRAVPDSGANFMQFHLSPFGKTALPQDMPDGEEMYLGDVEFWATYPDAKVEFTASFSCKVPEATGSSPKTVVGEAGLKYTLPETPYVLEGGTFLGWRYSKDKALYAAGTEFTLGAENVSFIAEYDYTRVGAPPFKALNYAEYDNGTMNNNAYATVEDTVFDGKSAVKVTPLPTGSFKDATVVLDAWQFKAAEIDLKKYNYLAITYYFEGNLPRDDVYMAAGLAQNGGALTGYYMPKSHEPLVANSWQIATFSLDLENIINHDNAHNFLVQMHIRPLFESVPAEYTEGQSIYINQLMFFEADPGIEMHESYMTGYDGGLFKPSATMTRAEACTIVARLAAGGEEKVPAETASRFSDVLPGKWYTKYVTYVDSLGYLGAYTGSFLPGQAITRAEFVELVYNMGLLKDKGQNGSFTDVAAGHPRANVIAAAGKAGLVNGYANGDGTFSFKPDATITRAEVVKVINNAYGRSVTKDAISDDVDFIHYDVPTTSWAYPEICEAVLPHIEANGEWIASMTHPKELLGGDARVNLAQGEAYLRELDALSAKRIEEIRNTPSMDISDKTGKIYYVSSSTGDDANDGLTPETAWKTVTKVSRMQSTLKAGDVVLFKRGDVWHNQRLAADAAGVTYSAYGEGNKPVITGSPQDACDTAKWQLVIPELPNFWVYTEELVDVGNIVFNYESDNPIWGYKEVPDLKDGKFYVRGSNYAHDFTIFEQLDNDLEFFCDIPNNDFKTKKGKLYLRCDEGNPAEVFDSINLALHETLISGSAEGRTFDNLCLLFGGAHGIGSGTTKDLVVTNCEIGWIGGCIQYYRNPPEGTVRYGNGVEIFGGCDNFVVDNCYVYQNYDAGLTHQYTAGNGEDVRMDNIRYTNNVIEDCIYSIEYWLTNVDTGVREAKNHLFANNIMRRAGYGFGITRPNGCESAHLMGRGGMPVDPGTFVIENNIFDRSCARLFHNYAATPARLPIYRGNTFVEVLNKTMGYYTGERLVYDSVADYTIRLTDLKDADARVYWVGPEYAFTYRGYTYLG